MNATPKFLLEGSYYALVQCEKLLNSAVIIYKAGDHATAVGLTLLAREELGRSRYLRDQRKDVVKGKTVPINTISKACENHLMKQKLGQHSVVLKTPGLAKHLQVISGASPQSKEYQEADQILDKLTKKKMARTPHDRLAEREKSFYVQPDDLGTGWDKPWEKDKEEAIDTIQHAINDYSVYRRQFVDLAILMVTDCELAKAIEAWVERPTLPPPLLVALEEVQQGLE